MPKEKSIYICQQCGYQSPRWLGKCPDCMSWNSFLEEMQKGEAAARGKLGNSSAGRVMPVRFQAIETQSVERYATHIDEFDRVLGGGLVPQSVILFSGEPGIGKSTFLLQICHALEDKKILYISGEESSGQIKQRAERLRIQNKDHLYFLGTVNLIDIDQAIDTIQPEVVIIDSIQTIYHPDLESTPGNVAQVRECASFLFRKAKEQSFILFLIGHVTKDGTIAGPKVLEHLVDVVLHMEGDHRQDLRLLRSKKNRFGNTFELGVFRMTSAGLEQVSDTARFFLERPEFEFSGTALTAIYESRVLFLEVQALAGKTPFGMPQRTVMGFDHRRLSLILAILEKRLGLMLKNYDIFVKVLGGIRVEDPAVDMAVAMSVISSYYDFVIPSDHVFIGELGLGGEFRPVPQIEQRVEEAGRLGFRKIFLPSGYKLKRKSGEVELAYVSSIQKLLQEFRSLVAHPQAGKK